MKPSVILFIALVLRVLAFQLGPVLSDDVYRYHWDGRVQANGFNPYAYAPDAPELSNYQDSHHDKINHPTIKTIYPPVSQLAFQVAYRLYSHPNSQRALFLLFDGGIIVLLLLFLAHRQRDLRWVALYALNPLVILEFSASGHNDSLMLFLLLGSFLLFERKNEGTAGFVMGLAALSKFVPLILIPWFLVQRRWRFLGVFAITFLLGLIPFFLGPDGFHGLQTFTAHWVFNGGLFWLVQQILPHPFILRIIFGLILVGLAFYVAQLAREDVLAYALVMFLAVLLLSPLVHPWYVTWIVPFLCFIPLRGGTVWTAVVLLSYVVLIQYKREGIWHLPLWARLTEYTFVYSFLLWDAWERLVSTIKTKTMEPLSESDMPIKWVSVVIPALNEENAVRNVIVDIPRDKVKEIIVVDNGSKDNTVQVAHDSGAKVIEEPKSGYGQAVQAGLAAVDRRCDTVVILDGDYSDYPEDLNLLIQSAEEHKAGMVIGSRVHNAQPGSLTPQQRFGNWLTCFLISRLYGFHFSDMGPFRLIRKDVLDQLHMNDKNYGWNVEMQVKALRKGVRVAEVPVQYRPRIGHSKISGTVKGTVMAGVTIIKSVFRYGLITF